MRSERFDIAREPMANAFINRKIGCRGCRGFEDGGDDLLFRMGMADGKVIAALVTRAFQLKGPCHQKSVRNTRNRFHPEGMQSISPALPRPYRGYAGYANRSKSTPKELNHSQT